jgi:hypothetical protein
MNRQPITDLTLSKRKIGKLRVENQWSVTERVLERETENYVTRMLKMELLQR